MEKKYQIFISSTFDDLKNERNEVAKAILEIGDIPVGMEMFSAADETQWKLIQRQIEQSDYYVVIVAHRYGSMAGDVSYTEREYNYAVEIGVPVLGFVIEESVQWPPNFVDKDPDVRRRLDTFKNKVKSRMVSFWNNADGLAGRVLAALGKQKNLAPRPGWVRAINLPGAEVMGEFAKLGQEVARLSEENADLKQKASTETTYSLIDAMADDVECQAVILMYETERDLPRYIRYVYGNENGRGGSGSLGGLTGRDRLLSSGIVRPAGGGSYLTLTDLGKGFAEWLIRKGRKCDYFWTPMGEWGSPKEGSHHATWVQEAKEGEKRPSVPLPASQDAIEVGTPKDDDSVDKKTGVEHVVGDNGV